MAKKTEQIDKWANVFGKEYTDRNLYNPRELDEFYKKTWGVTRTELNEEFLSFLDKDKTKILEVGSNVGNQLLSLQLMGFKNLYGIEISKYAVEKSKERTKDINIIYGSAFDLPFKDEYFDLVFTAGVLIHISPNDINYILDEIYRCSKKYIFGFEYYADKYTEIEYRGNKNMLWKANFCQMYLDRFKYLKLVKEKKLKYVDNDNVDSVFLIEKYEE
ncbi:MAG: methyltransferase type 11 [Candidatus Altiarchaeales archaeon HGW-Altiarchaeales-1]|nr:MAG: methyltransferase type 11 [Candidatus Altiarchaeales archaeon HGW-Altiarchaeales-1]